MKCNIICTAGRLGLFSYGRKYLLRKDFITEPVSHNIGYLVLILLHISEINQKDSNCLNKWKHTHPPLKIKQDAPLYYHHILLHANTFRSYSDCKQLFMEGTPPKCLFRFDDIAEDSLLKAFAISPSLLGGKMLELKPLQLTSPFGRWKKYNFLSEMWGASKIALK